MMYLIRAKLRGVLNDFEVLGTRLKKEKSGNSKRCFFSSFSN